MQYVLFKRQRLFHKHLRLCMNKTKLKKCDIWCIFGFGGLIDGYSALGVVYEVSLEVVMTMHAGCAGDAGIAIWRARLFAAHLRVGA